MRLNDVLNKINNHSCENEIKYRGHCWCVWNRDILKSTIRNLQRKEKRRLKNGN